MCNNRRAFKERSRTDAFGAIDNLVGEYKRPRRNLFTEGTDGGESKDGPYAQRFESRDVGTGRNSGRMNSVSYTMTRQKSNLLTRWKGTDSYR